MSHSIHLFITSSLATALAIGCGGPDEFPRTPAAPPETGRMYDQGAAHFLTAALQSNAQDASYTYTIASTGAEPERVTIGVSGSTGLATGPAALASESSVEWCTPESPLVAVSKNIWCQSCNKKDAEDCARQWAFTTAKDFCATQISTSDGADACAPESFTGALCVDTTSQGITCSVQVGSDTACGIWPGRHAAWKVTYNVTGNCGYSCRASL
jgi:hypothetical protein